MAGRMRGAFFWHSESDKLQADCGEQKKAIERQSVDLEFKMVEILSPGEKA